VRAPRARPARSIPFWTVGGLAVSIMLCVAAWQWLRPVPASTPVQATTASPERGLSYFLTVQKYRDGKPYQGEFQSTGREIFESGWRFKLNLTSPEEGFLYLLNQEPGGNYVLLFPFPSHNSGSAHIEANERLETDWYVFDKKPGTEQFRLVWAGQFVRIRLEQRAIDSVLILTAPDGKQMVEVNLTGVGDEESLSLEALTAGSYKLTVRAIGAATMRGSYELETTFRARATEQDRKRLTAEALLREVKELGKPSGKTTLQAIEKIQQALTMWRELVEPHWAAYSLWMLGDVYRDTNQLEKAIEYYEELLAFSRQFKLRAKEGIALGNLGICHSGVNHPDKAVEYQEQSLAIKYELKDLHGQANILLNRANSYLFLSRY
jgi:tetratricopeptide (TPR) repeat protein